MNQLDEALLNLRTHEGVEHVLLVGVDGLLVRHSGEESDLDPDRVSAMVPGLISAVDALGEAVGGGACATAVLELERGVAIVMPLSPELLLAVVLRSGVPFSKLLREVRRDRSHIAALV
ncbi:MAG TPA: roadblock/LC7 domain-containing protein [Longimicrobiaceae bacterium]